VIRIDGESQREVGDRALIILLRDHRAATVEQDLGIGRRERQRLGVVRDRTVQITLARADHATIRVLGG